MYNYALAIGDIPTDITYWNTKTGHFDGIYTYTFTDTDTYLRQRVISIADSGRHISREHIR